MNIESDAKGSQWRPKYQTAFHEFGHNIDQIAGGKFGQYSFQKYSAVYQNGIFQQTLKEETEAQVAALDKLLKAEFKAHSKDIAWLRENKYLSYMDEWKLERGQPLDFKYIKYSKARAYSALQKEIRAIPEHQREAVSDIMEGCTSCRVEGGFGHGKTYWKDRPDGIGSEAFAEFYQSTVQSKEARAVLEKYFPKSAKIFDEMIQNIAAEEW
jgi:hypothetical protein